MSKKNKTILKKFKKYIVNKEKDKDYSCLHCGKTYKYLEKHIRICKGCKIIVNNYGKFAGGVRLGTLEGRNH